MKVVILKPGRAEAALYGHPWIFSGAIASKDPNIAHGEAVEVRDNRGLLVGSGFFSTTSTITIRLYTRDAREPDRAFLHERLTNAQNRRELMGYTPEHGTTGYRLCFGEADGLPGVVIDRFNDVFVLQISTKGAEKIQPLIVDMLTELFSPRTIVERSDVAGRREEGLPEQTGVLFGESVDAVPYLEHGIEHVALVQSGQKTGAFLDQKSLRQSLTFLAKGKTCANVFCYTGATTRALLAGGATRVTQVDSSAIALAGAPTGNAITTVEADAFAWLSESPAYTFDLVAIDPPALIKTQKDKEAGLRAYHFLNRAALRLVKPGGIFVTSSCSHFLSEDDFAHLLRRAASQNQVELLPIARVAQSPDHPVPITFPEAAYLKSFIFHVRPYSSEAPTV